MNDRDRETFERFARRLSSMDTEIADPPPLEVARTTRIVRGRSSARPIGSVLATIVIVVVIAAIGSALAGQSPVPTESLSGGLASAAPSPTPTPAIASPVGTARPAETSVAATPKPAPGCGPSDVGQLEESPYVRVEDMLSHPIRVPPFLGMTIISSLDQVRVKRIEPIFPKRIPGNRTIQVITVIEGTSQVSVLYGVQPTDYSTSLDPFFFDGGIALTEQAFAGNDAAQVLDNAIRNTWPVQVGPYPAALVHGDEYATGHRGFDLYWSDGPRQWVLAGEVDPDDLIDMARSIYCATQPEASSTPAPEPLIPANECQALGLALPRCTAVVEAARAQRRLEWSNVDAVHLDPDDQPGAVRTMSFVANVRFMLKDGSSQTQLIACGVGGQYSPICSDHPQIRVSTIGDGYWDVPCSGEAPDGCATPLPTIDPANARGAEALRVPAQDFLLAGPGSYEIEVGSAVLPNGILTEATFQLADPAVGTFVVESAVRLEVRPVDPSRPPFENGYARGWSAGNEKVLVYLVFDVTSAEPGATLQVRDLVVR